MVSLCCMHVVCVHGCVSVSDIDMGFPAVLVCPFHESFFFNFNETARYWVQPISKNCAQGRVARFYTCNIAADAAKSDCLATGWANMLLLDSPVVLMWLALIAAASF